MEKIKQGLLSGLAFEQTASPFAVYEEPMLHELRDGVFLKSREFIEKFEGFSFQVFIAVAPGFQDEEWKKGIEYDGLRAIFTYQHHGARRWFGREGISPRPESFGLRLQMLHESFEKSGSFFCGHPLW